MANLVLFGVTGLVGGKILNEAAQRDHRITAVARNVDTIHPHENVQPVPGSIYDTDLIGDLLTLDRYSHWMPSKGQDTAGGIDKALG